MRAHGADEGNRAWCQGDAALENFIDHRDRKTLQEGHAFAQRGFEFDLAAHGALGDGGDVRLETDEVGEFVNAFLADHG